MCLCAIKAKLSILQFWKRICISGSCAAMIKPNHFECLKTGLKTMPAVSYLQQFLILIDADPLSEFNEFNPRLRQKPVSIKRRLKSWNIEYNFKWNQPYLSGGLKALYEDWIRYLSGIAIFAYRGTWKYAYSHFKS